MIEVIRRESHSVDRRGAVTVEAALVLPLVLGFFFAFWQWSQVESIRQTATMACFEAARAGTLPTATATDMTAAATDVLNRFGIRGFSVVSGINNATSMSDASVAVVLDENLAAGQLFGGKTLNVSYSLSLETQPD